MYLILIAITAAVRSKARPGFACPIMGQKKEAKSQSGEPETFIWRSVQIMTIVS